MSSLVEEFGVFYEKFQGGERGSSGAGTKARNALQEIKKLSQNLRVEIQNTKKERSAEKPTE